ncbi:class I alpha-mannosidase 1A [Coccidioides immitis RMSCC 2394]|uniref:alpha-1,2-Mannosidase n=1 Tax=Coccidioides immitis RMSCC 2394 TaxID=404692 RepID=A0A0J6Y223_COCIT|nr:class I alpha-mannosidase 1A [Coccidioides immitis RMSCC 2394]
MPRFRRYRVFLVFAVISILALFHFTRLRELGSSIHNSNESTAEQQKPAAPPALPPQRPPEQAGHNGEIQNPPASPSKARIPSVVTNTKQGSVKPSVQPTSSPAPTRPALVSPPSSPKAEFGPGGQGRLEVPELDRTDVRWVKQPENFPVVPSNIIPLPKGKPKNIPKIQFNFPEESQKAKLSREKRLSLIKASFKRSWAGYKTHAWGRDELKPVFGGGRDPFMGWGATLVDSLDTLWIMGFEKEFAEAVKAVEQIDFKTSNRKDIPLFETVIRYLGGLIGAYDICEGRYPILLDKAIELAEILMGAFDTPNRMPQTYYWWAPSYASQPHRAPTRAVLAELGSLSLEFTRLAQLTLQNKYYDAVARITNELEKFQSNTTLPGLWPSLIDASGCKKILRNSDELEDVDGSVKMPPLMPKANGPPEAPKKRNEAAFKPLQNTQPANPNSQSKATEKRDLVGFEDGPDCEEQGLMPPPFQMSNTYTLGALADSTYEYLPKMHLLLGGLSYQYHKMYTLAMDTAKKYLLFRPMLPDNRDVLFHAKVTSSKPPEKKEDLYSQYEGTHLGCFAGGMFALGAKIFGVDGDLDLAAKLTDACVWAYNATATGIMPEGFEMLPCASTERCEWNETRYYEKIDPYEEERKLQVQTWLDQKAELEKVEGVERAEFQATEIETSHLSKSAVSKGSSGLAKRQRAMPDDPSRISGIDDSIPGILGPKPTFVPHKDFVEQRLKEERIPYGMTDILSRKYILRPEAIESVFYMYRITGDESWREKGWEMFKAVEASTRTELGSSAIKDVTSQVPIPLNEMESFWLGETLKYFFLLFSDPDVVSLDDYIFNTEAHPLRMPQKV